MSDSDILTLTYSALIIGAVIVWYWINRLIKRQNSSNQSIQTLTEALNRNQLDINIVAKARDELALRVNQNYVHKNDATYQKVMDVLAEAAKTGEGLFLVRYMKEGTYLWHVDKKDVVELPPKEIKTNQ